MQKLIEGAAGLGLKLAESQLKQFQTYSSELVDWNRRVNLTAITAYEDVQVKHFLDSLTVTLILKELPNSVGIRMIDIGTGAGFPGIPLKIVLPDIRLTLLESTGKKALFLDHIRGVLGLGEVEIVTARAEDAARLQKHRGKYDVALSRAVAALPALLELALPFCKTGGIFVAQKLAKAKTEIAEAARAASLLGGRLREVKDIDLPELAGRCLIVYEKVSPTPTRYPRPPGIPSKEPLV